ncbi:melanoma-associated antigen E1 [Saimiri boliviensis]|uniref:melanoma-associated antigen E1 n=1 Tax=Saimiri boliviensis TaxID=27679 RepID=UPI00193E02EA|nr:melanoma-associated antigen E1 [Saimiri boliviensis boliviensis]
MSLVSQNSRRRRRRGAKATAHNSEIQAPNAPGLPGDVAGSDVPQGSIDSQILQGLCASEGPSTSVLPTSAEGPSTFVPPNISEASSASGQPTVSEGTGTSVLPTPSEGLSTSGPPTMSKGLCTSVTLAASEGQNTSRLPTSSEEPSTSLPPTVSERPSTSVPPTPGEGTSTSVPPTAFEGPSTSVVSTVADGPSTSVPPTPGEEASTSVSLTATEGLSISVPATPDEGLSTSVPPNVPEGLSTSVPPTPDEGPSTSVPATSNEGPSTSVLPAASDKQSTSLVPTFSKGSSTSVLPTATEGLSTSVQPTPGEGLSISVPPTPGEGLSISVPPTPGEGLSTSVPPTATDGPSTSVPPTPSEGPSNSVPPTASEGPSSSVLPTPGEGKNTSVLPTASEGPSTSMVPTPYEGPSPSVLANPGEGPSTSLLPTVSDGQSTSFLPTPSKGSSTSVPPATTEGLSTSVQPSHGEGPSTSVPPTLGEGLCTSVPSTATEGLSITVPPTPGEGPSTLVQPTASNGPGSSVLPTPGEGPSTLFSSSASMDRNPSKCSVVLPSPGESKASVDSDSECPKGAEGPIEFQVLRDCESPNSITIMGLSTSRVAITLKPQDPMEQNVAELLQFLLVKDQSKYPIRESEMREYIVKEYRNQFPEILRRAAAHLECIFRFELRELDPEAHTYILLNKLGPVPFEGLEESPNGPKMGLLMMILGQIFLNGNQAKEAEIWEMLWRMGVQRERRLSIFGNPKRLLSVEFVWQRYLDYRPVSDCKPVEYEFFWGPRSHIETTKMKILKFMAKIYNKDPMDWPEQYNEALEEDAARAFAEGWQALPHFRRPFFEEVAGEVASPDSEVSNYSSKYPPHSWPESRLESKARKLVQLFLLMDSTKLPIPKKGILYYIGRECSKVFPDLLNRAARTLNHVYGTELVVLDPRNHSYTLYNRREMEETEEIVDSPNRPGNNFLMQVLSFIFIMGNHARESAVWAFLRGLGVQSGRKHVITCRYLSQRYIDSLRVPDSDPVQYEFVWGPRARLETSKMKALRYVARIHRKEPQDWPQQYREAMEDEANRADIGHRQFFVHNFR